jgi:hypothetical protein
MPHKPGEETFQPVVVPFVRKDGTPGMGGNLGSFKAEKFAELKAKMSPEAAARIQAAADATTAEVMGGDPLPAHARLLWLCKSCREKARVPTFCRETAKAGLLRASQAIGIRDDRDAAFAVLGRPQRHAVGAGPSNGRRYDNRGNGRNRDDRPAKPRTDWHGVSLETATAAALVAAGYNNLADALRAAESGELLAKGIAHPGSVGTITFALKRASEGRTTVGQASGAISAARHASEAPGAARPKARGKKREFAAPAAASRGKGVGLADLRG